MKRTDDDCLIIFREDGTIIPCLPKLQNDSDSVPSYIQFVLALSILLNNNDEYLHEYIWEKWNIILEEHLKNTEGEY